LFAKEIFTNDIYFVKINEDYLLGEFRKLEVRKIIILNNNEYFRFLTTSKDVLHRLALPTLGLKIDSIPGRLNQQSIFSKRLGKFYGQCSEICGANHRFMPINIEVI